MNEAVEIDTQQAPVLGESTDIDPGVVTPEDAVESGSTDGGDAQQTIATPDELGGTGGEQAGGAG